MDNPMQFLSIFGYIALTIFLVILLRWIISLRIVVPPDEVHIVQSAKATRSYGRSRTVENQGDGPKNTTHGNTYYAWPAWIPGIGVTVSKLLVSIFPINLQAYVAYDRDRVPFELDLAAFFRISDTNMAAERVKNIDELKAQLTTILKGCARKILANSPIDGDGGILSNRAVFGDEFTKEVQTQLLDWGTVPVKTIELMDIRDTGESKVIENIQAVKQSEIDKNSRLARAANGQAAQTAEIEAHRGVNLAAQEAEEQVGRRTAEKTKNVGIAEQASQQEIAEASAKTAEANMAVRRVNETKAAEIAKTVAETRAAQDREVNRINAEGVKLKTVTEAEGQRDAAVAIAEGVRAEGEAKGAAETALLMAPVTAQTTLAAKIGENKDYQDYMVRIEGVKKDQAVGIAQAGALAKADIKIVAGASDPASGLNLISLGTQLGALWSAVKNTETSAGK